MMSTVDGAADTPEVIFARLAAPFANAKSRPGPNGTTFEYIEAEQAMMRLDDVVGPGEWQEDYEIAGETVICRLKLNIPGGSGWLTRCGASAFDPRKQGEQRDRLPSVVVKTTFSEAFKKAAEKFGIGRYLKTRGKFPAYYQRIAAAAQRQAPERRESETSPATTHPGPAAPPRAEEFPARPQGSPGAMLFKKYTNPPFGAPWVVKLKEFGQAQRPPYPDLIKNWTAEQCAAFERSIAPKVGVPAPRSGEAFDEFEEAMTN